MPTIGQFFFWGGGALQLTLSNFTSRSKIFRLLILHSHGALTLQLRAESETSSIDTPAEAGINQIVGRQRG
jgi:hypothetical protein